MKKHEKQKKNLSMEALKKTSKDLRAQIKSLCNDTKFADELINKLISTQKQIDIEPTLVHIPVSNVIKTYDYGHFKIEDTKDGIIFSSTGYKMIVRPIQQSLYGQLKALLVWKEEYETFSDEQKENYDNIFFRTTTILLNPLLAFTDDDFWMSLSQWLAEKQNDLFAKLLNEPLKDEDMVADDAFMENVKLTEDLKDEAEKLSDGTENAK